uniref:Ovule protein n=1 Tax=Rodentolepis nana TaxID=102285 RepID=A0A0R3TXR3_RODNA
LSTTTPNFHSTSETKVWRGKKVESGVTAGCRRMRFRGRSLTGESEVRLNLICTGTAVLWMLGVQVINEIQFVLKLFTAGLKGTVVDQCHWTEFI